MARVATHPLIHGVLAAALAGVWLYAALPKLLSPASLLGAIKTYQMLPHTLEVALALWLPWVEVCAALALLLPRWRCSGAWLSLGLLLVFLVGIIQGWLRGLNITCGCFGGPAVTTSLGYVWLVGRDVALIAVCLFLLRVPRLPAGQGSA